MMNSKLLMFLVVAISLSVCASGIQRKPCRAEDYSKLYPDPSDCRRFFECSPLGLVPFKCPAGLYFNPPINVCDYPRNVRCHNRSIESSVARQPCDPEDIDKLYPDPSDCRKFYECSSFGLVSFTCPANLIFNPPINVCDYPENVECRNN